MFHYKDSEPLPPLTYPDNPIPQIGNLVFIEGTNKTFRVEDVQFQYGNITVGSRIVILKIINIILRKV